MSLSYVFWSSIFALLKFTKFQFDKNCALGCWILRATNELFKWLCGRTIDPYCGLIFYIHNLGKVMLCVGWLFIFHQQSSESTALHWTLLSPWSLQKWIIIITQLQINQIRVSWHQIYWLDLDVNNKPSDSYRRYW